MDIEIGEITSHVRAIDDSVLVDPRVTQMLVNEMMAHVRDRDAHAHRVRKERGINAGRTTEEIP